MSIIFTPGKRTADGKRTYIAHDGHVKQGEGWVKEKEIQPLVITEHGVKPPLTPIELKREAETNNFLSRFRGERE